MIGRSGERGSGISVLAARHDDDDECHEQSYLEETEGVLSLLLAHRNQKKKRMQEV